MSYAIISFDQPAGTFLLTVMPAEEVIRIARADPRKFDESLLDTRGGIQREISRRRIKEIASYAKTVDAAFPTPILLALNEDQYQLGDGEIEILGDHVADVVDGQHRIEGLKLAGQAGGGFNIPVVLLLDATEETKALMFATINGKQTRVPASLIYDLFGVTEGRSPQKTAHEIARALNSMEDSPWFRRLKMLGRKTPGSMESLSQGTFVKFLLKHICRNPDAIRDILKKGDRPPTEEEYVFNEYFLRGQDSTILKILMNVFNAAKETWPNEWQNPAAYTLTKTQGFSGIMTALSEMVNSGKGQADLSTIYFRKIFSVVKRTMDADGIEFTVQHFPSSQVGESKFRDIILDALVSLKEEGV